MKLACLLAIGALAAPAQLRLPEYTREVLPNGVVVYVMAKSEVPMITLRAVVRGGSESDPETQAGLASLTADLLRSGTATRSAGEFSEELDFIGATYSTSVDEQSTVIRLGFLSKDADSGLELLVDAILNPVFPEAEVEKTLARRIDAVKAIKDNLFAANGRYFRAFFFPAGHPYARQVGGDEVSLDRIRRQDIINYHQRAYCGKNVIIVAVGDLEPAPFLEKLSAAFGKLKAGKRYEWAQQVPQLNREGARMLLVDKPGATQTYFQIGQPGIDRKHPDRDTLRLVNTLFGGRFTSMLNEELRINRGLTYGARCQVDRNRLRGALSIETYTQTEKTTEAMDVALEVLNRFREQGISEEQLASAKAYIQGGFQTSNFETDSQLSQVLGSLELFGLGPDEINRFFQRIDAVTLEQANAAIKKHYSSDALQFVLVGDAGKIREQISKYADDLLEAPITEPGFGAKKSSN